jgi:hypothetical protein
MLGKVSTNFTPPFEQVGKSFYPRIESRFSGMFVEFEHHERKIAYFILYELGDHRVNAAGKG